MERMFKTKKPMFWVPIWTLLQHDPSSDKYTIEGTKVWFFIDELIAWTDFFEEDTPLIQPVTFPSFTPVSLKKGKSFIYYSLQSNSWDTSSFNPSNAYHLMMQSMGLALQESYNNHSRMNEIEEMIRDFVTRTNNPWMP